jgi:hypothetical protein
MPPESSTSYEDPSFLTTTYTAKGETKLCELCNQEVDSKHCQTDATHIIRVKEIRTFQGAACLLDRVNNVTADCLSGINELNNADKEKVCARLFWYMLSTPSESNEQLEDAKAMISKLKYRERVGLLELAVWRSACLMHAPKHEMAFADWIEWYRKGWKADKTRMRRSNAISIIMARVLPFLDSPSDQ